MNDEQLTATRSLISYVRESEAKKGERHDRAMLEDCDMVEDYLDEDVQTSCTRCGCTITLDHTAFYPNIHEGEDEEGNPVLNNDWVSEPYCEACSKIESAEALEEFKKKHA